MTTTIDQRLGRFILDCIAQFIITIGPSLSFSLGEYLQELHPQLEAVNLLERGKEALALARGLLIQLAKRSGNTRGSREYDSGLKTLLATGLIPINQTKGISNELSIRVAPNTNKPWQELLRKQQDHRDVNASRNQQPRMQAHPQSIDRKQR